MDDLMNKITALVEAHVKSEVEARKLAELEGEVRIEREALIKAITLLPASSYADAMQRLKALRTAADQAQELAIDRDRAARDAQALRERVQELELKLLEVRKVAELEPAKPLEVGGFRVGDLARTPSSSFVPVEKLYQGPSGWWYVRINGGEWEPESLTRKHVDVGDLVRCTGGAFAGRFGRVVQYVDGNLRVKEEPSGGHFTTKPRSLVAIAP